MRGAILICGSLLGIDQGLLAYYRIEKKLAQSECGVGKALFTQVFCFSDMFGCTFWAAKKT